ncbi:hypothetical protein B0T26DRAFT_240178 [Lasiosphaeria miniovina]|uniref:Uncharacterized protein n=1 Tax=Lasiosphaeria miniovina TaxID=1954250 RepID=A0AA40E574_9PEZI|nr:uncharacterized protein B0T26DRAFT_240178 [Lasiosphaeria miniovina]KAK0722913.1 hypothetical protein B0T26DRAFT_240178 [Lasiosphaeria miniovina]
MPFSIFSGTEKLFHVIELPSSHSPDRHPHETLRTSLLFLRLHHPKLYPSDNIIDCAQRLKNVLSAPLVKKDASTSQILRAVALCKRELLEADSLEMAAYTEGGKLAIIALHVVSPGHRAKFLDRMKEIPIVEIRQLFAVLATIQPHKSFTEYIDLEITDHQVNKTQIRSQTTLLTRRKAPSSDEGGDRVKRKRRGKMGQRGGNPSLPDEEAVGNQGSGGSLRANSDSILPDPPGISNVAVLAPPPEHRQSPFADSHSHTVNGSPIGTSLPLPPDVSQYPRLMQNAAARFRSMRDALEMNPGVNAFGDGWIGLGALRDRGVFRDPFSQSIIPYEWRGVALQVVEGFMSWEKNQDICVSIYSHLLQTATQSLPLQALSIFTNDRIANATKSIDVIDFWEEGTKIYRITLYIERDPSIFQEIFLLDSSSNP